MFVKHVASTILQNRPTTAGATNMAVWEQPDPKRLKGLEKENAELKKQVAELTLDNRMLKDVV